LKLPVRVPTNQENRMRTMYGFGALGLAAKSAFPAIVAIALQSSDEWQRADAINALTDSDTDAMRGLAAGLTNPDRDVLLRAIFALTCIRIAPDLVCMPALEGVVNDPDPLVRAEAAKGITLFNQNLKMFAGFLTHRNPEMRLFAVQALGSYRTRARPYLVNLEAAVDDDDTRVRKAVAASIPQVRDRQSVSFD
jgi:HEAT repeat protein